MATVTPSLAAPEFTALLIALAERHGLPQTTETAGSVAGRASFIRAKWFLGGRKVAYAFSVQLDETARQARFREASSESSWGIPPPTLTVETTSQRGSRVTERRTDTGVGGGGTLNYGQLRQAAEAAARDSGWQFVFEAGRMPA